MTIKLPLRYQHLINKISEDELMLIAFMHLLKSRDPDTNWFSIYKYDLLLIANNLGGQATPSFIFRNLNQVLRAAYVSDHKLDIRFKHWDKREIDYSIKKYRNIIVWSFILDQGSLNETETNRPSETYLLHANPKTKHFVAALKKYSKPYDT